MAPEYGATCGIFPVDAESLRYLEFSGRPKEQVELVEAYCSEQGLFHNRDSEDATYSDTLPAGPFHRAAFPGGAAAPQDRVALSDAASDFEAELAELIGDGVEHEPPNGSHEEGVAESFPPAIRPRSPWTEDARASPATGTAAWSPSARGPPSRSATSSSTTAPW